MTPTPPKPEPVMAWCAVDPKNRIMHNTVRYSQEGARIAQRDQMDYGDFSQGYRIVRVRIEVVDE